MCWRDALTPRRGFWRVSKNDWPTPCVRVVDCAWPQCHPSCHEGRRHLLGDCEVDEIISVGVLAFGNCQIRPPPLVQSLHYSYLETCAKMHSVVSSQTVSLHKSLLTNCLTYIRKLSYYIKPKCLEVISTCPCTKTSEPTAVLNSCSTVLIVGWRRYICTKYFTLPLSSYLRTTWHISR